MGLVDAVTAPAAASGRARTPPVGTLPLSEVFGPTFQGEGPHTGRVCGFVRLGLCNLSCEWCDTPFTWDRSRYDVAAECPDTAVDVILDEAAALGCGLMVLSGGEPLMHSRGPRQGALRRLLAGLPTAEWHVETNGTIDPPEWMWPLVAHWTASPKVSTRDPESKRVKPVPLRRLAQLGAAFKFVCRDPHDVRAVDALCASVGIPASRVWLMPEGTAAAAVLATQARLAPLALERGYNLTTRLHVLVWGEERGR